MIIQQHDAKWWFALNGALRLAAVKGALNKFGRQLVVTEYPKSGGTWLSQMLSTAIGIHYPRNRLPHLSGQLIHGCYLDVASSVDTIIVWRDGRDIMVSFYYHLMFDKPITSAKYSQKLKELLNAENPLDIHKHFPAFIEWTFTGGYPGFSWADFVNRWADRDDLYQTSYERVTADPFGELRRALEAFDYPTDNKAALLSIVENFSFENQTTRKKGEEDVTQFIRKGIVGDWKNVFSSHAREIFHHYAGDELIRLGYEKDDAWVRKIDKN